MPAIKPLYDLVLLLDTAAEDSRRAEILAAAEDLVTKGGELVNKQDWGPRQMAFEIRHKKDADYHLLQFHATPELLSQLDRTLRITDEVVRFRIIKLAPGTPPPPDQRSEPRPAGISSEGGESAPAESGDDAPAEAPAAEVEAEAPAQAEAPAAETAEPVAAEAAAPAGDAA
jgi:small subunit ribosomal protein S6